MTNLLNPLTFPLHGTRLIEASAGTGKTYTIAALYLRLILGHDEAFGYGRPLIPPEILVVTFTNAATQELRDRIRNRLIQAAAFFRKKNEGDDFLRRLRDTLPPDSLPEKAWTLDRAAQWMDEAAIFTIHGWAQRMLRQHAFDSNSLFDLTLEPNDRELLEESARDYWRTFLYPLPLQSLKELLGHIQCNTPQDLLKSVRPLFGVPSDASADPFALLEKQAEAIETARQQWALDLDQAVHRLRRAKEEKVLSGVKYKAGSFDQWLEQVTRWATDDGPFPDEKVCFRFSAAGLKEGVNKNKAAPEHPAYAAFDRMNEQLEALAIKPAFFAHAAREIMFRYEEEKQNRGQLGYDDLLTRLAGALFSREGGSLARRIRQQFPIALIDEFQDTDPLQYSAFEKIYGGRSDTGLVMIGDPKQAIYAFRGADIHTYLNARRKTGDSRYTLGKNYRSTAGMIESVNQMFRTADQYPQGPFLFKDEIPFDDVAANGLDEKLMVENKTVDSIYMWLVPQTEPLKKTGETGYLSQLAKGFAEEIVRLLVLARKSPPQAIFSQSDNLGRPLEPADIAVLVRNRQEAAIIRQSLENRGVKSVFLSNKESVYRTSEAEDLLFLLRACANPSRDDLLRAAVATETISLTINELDRFNEDEQAWELQVERFRRYRQIWRLRGVLPMLRTLFHEYHVPAKRLSAFDGERALTNLLHLSELLQTAWAGLEGEDALIQWMVDRIQDPEESLEEEILRLESDSDVVRVITIHKSKGLEFPLVFLPFICSYRNVTAGNTPVAIYHDNQGRKRAVTEPTDQDLAAVENEQLAEDLRLLYVAVTRARFACWLGIAVTGSVTKKEGEKSELHRSGIGYLIGGGENIPVSLLREKLETLRGNCGEIAIASLPEAGDQNYFSPQDASPQGTARIFSRHLLSDWSITSYSGIVAGAGHKEGVFHAKESEKTLQIAADSAIEDQLQEADISNPTPFSSALTGRSIHTFPRGPQPGVLLHDLLEWSASCGFATIARDRIRMEDQVQLLCRRNAWEAWGEVLTDWLQRFIKTPIPLPYENAKLRLDQLPAGSYQAELEFLFAAHEIDTLMIDDAVTNQVLPGIPRPKLKPSLINGMLKGFIDLTVCYQDRYYVLDYKSNHLGDDERSYTTDALSAAILEHRYDLQYVLYTLAMHRQLKARLPGYTYDTNMGGGIYLFLRGVNATGNGIFVDRPPGDLIERLDNTFAGQEANRAT